MLISGKNTVVQECFLLFKAVWGICLDHFGWAIIIRNAKTYRTWRHGWNFRKTSLFLYKDSVPVGLVPLV